MMKRASSKKDNSKHSSSKYDFVKVRVWLSQHHYYVLSRFLVSRVLTAIKIDYSHAIQIALELKKTLVDKETLDVTQSVLQEDIFKILSNYGYGPATVDLYHMMSRFDTHIQQKYHSLSSKSFHHQRIPLIILIGGTACVGKSSLATQLAERLNLPSVLQTDVTVELMMSILSNGDNKTKQSPLRRRMGSMNNEDEVLQLYKQECALVKKGLSPDFEKCLREGKSMIVEGLHVNSMLYLDVIKAAQDHQQVHQPNPTFDSAEDDQMWHLSQPVSGIVIPFLLTLQNEEDHQRTVQDWWQHQSPQFHQESDSKRMLQSSRLLQSFLEEDVHHAHDALATTNTSASVVVVPLNVSSFTKTLDMMHLVFLLRLQKIFERKKAGE